MPGKRCTACHLFLSLDEFEPFPEMSQGHAHGKVCLDCIERRKRQKHAKSIYKSYKLTQSAYDALLYAQKERCAICRRHIRTLPRNLSAKRRMLVVDHDHKTGKVRGLLCSTCNTALGNFYDSIPALRRAIRYLQAAQDASPPLTSQPETQQPSLFDAIPKPKRKLYRDPDESKYSRVARSLRAIKSAQKQAALT